MGAFAEKLAAIHRGRRRIVALDVAAPAAGFVATLGEWGAAGVMVVAAGRGVGDLPDCPIHYVKAESAESIMGRIRRVEEAFTDPSVAPKAVAACRFAARLWGIDLADLEPVPDLGE